jgi:hypothetical protein
MKYEELIDFLEHKMSMSHIYQPLLVRALVDAGGAAALRQLAQVFPSLACGLELVSVARTQE